MESIRVLYVEDDPRDQELTCRHLARHAPHLKLTVVGTVAEAFDRLTVGDLDLILSDYRLPDGTGLELLEEVKRRKTLVPVVLVTGSGGVDTAIQLLKAGAADYVVKRPDYLATLPHVLEGAFRWFQSVGELRRAPVRVLYVEHDPADVELARRAIADESSHFHLHVVPRGRDALERLRGVAYDLLLVDYRLPDMSGVELLKALRDEGLRIPIVMVTGQGAEETAVQAFKLGVSDYIVKRDGYLAKLPSTLENVLAQRRLADEKNALLVLNDLTKTIATFEDPGELARRVARAASDLLLTEAAIVWLLDELTLRPAGLAGIDEPAAAALGCRVDARFVERAVAERKVALGDLRRHLGDAADATILARPGGLAVSLIAAGRLLGVLAVATDRPRDFTAVEERLLTILADHAAVAIDNAKLYQRVRDQLAELQRAQAQLLQTEKVAAMGQLLAGVAHELNNPLAVMTGHAVLLQRGATDPAVVERVRRIADAAERCARIVRNFLALARQHSPERQPVSLSQVVRDAVELLAYQLRVNDVQVVFDLADDVPVLWADPHHLHQVVVNLVSNANHAMRAAPPPRRLTLVSRADPTRACVALRVTDTGSGIPPEVQARIFEPFFTTKPVGEGTGLGLALCRGMIEGHGGTIRVESAPGRGTTFIVELPVQAPPESRSPAPAETPRVPGKTILVVDDEPDVAGLLAELLAVDGHRVETVTDGASALARLREGRYDLVLSDLRMPGLGGPDLYREVERLDPALLDRFIFLTGDILAPETREFLERPGVVFVRKPFAIEEIRRAVWRRLEAR